MAKITLTCGGQTPQRSRELLEGFRCKKRHSTRRDVNFLNMPKHLDFDQKWGLGGHKPRKIGYFFKWSLYPCFSTDFDGKRCFGLLKYRSLTYQVRGSGKQKSGKTTQVEKNEDIFEDFSKISGDFFPLFFRFPELYDDITRFSTKNDVSIVPGGPKKTFQLWGCIANKLHYRETSNLDGLMS